MSIDKRHLRNDLQLDFGNPAQAGISRF